MSNSLKIFFVINTVSVGGAERVASRLCSFWAKDNDVTLIQTSFSPKKDYRLDERINFINLCEEKRISRISLISKLTKLFKKNKPDVVISFIDSGHFYTSIAARKAKIKHICSERNDPYHSPSTRIFKFMRKFAFNRCDAIVFQTKGAMDYFPPKIQKKGVIIGNPLSSNDYVQADVETLKKSNRIISFGRLEQQKNYPLLINSFALFVKQKPDFCLDIFGRGSEKESLVNLIKNIGLSDKVFIHEFSTEIKKEIANSKVFVMSSFHEGLPNSLIESISSGVPCISTDAMPGGPRQILSYCKGSILVKNNDVDEMVQALLKMTNHYDQFIKDAQTDAKIIRDIYSIDKICREWIKLIEKI